MQPMTDLQAKGYLMEWAGYLSDPVVYLYFIFEDGEWRMFIEQQIPTSQTED
jgi:hypothetical protein